MRIALAQINTTVGDFPGNLERIREAARGVEASVVVFPELTVCGYMPRDLLEEPSFLDACERSLWALAGDASLPPLLVGSPVRAPSPGKPLHNAAVLIRDGNVVPVAKRLLPTYDVFDEHRYFQPGPVGAPVMIDGVSVGITVCEDIWDGALYRSDPVADLCKQGAEIIVNISASPYARGKPARRRELVRAHAAENGVNMVLCNLVGANDQLVFDGGSFATKANGRRCTQLKSFVEDIAVLDFTQELDPPELETGDEDEVRDALVLGIRDYFSKTGFERAVIGLSGGVDSSLVACLAVDALGAAHVTGIAMPGPFSADMSEEDAAALADGLGVAFHSFAITESYERLAGGLPALWGDRTFGLAEENLQARLRGLVLMAFANKTGSLVLVPSNKSEFAMGYCTLYGDMVGALAPISDLYKGQVYELARRYPAIPERVLTRPPSAELRPDQTDQDSLPPYEVLDEILRLHLEERLRPREICARGFDEAVVGRIVRAVSLQEYKRQQAAPVLKVTGKAFGLGGRRFPIVERFLGGAPYV